MNRLSIFLARNCPGDRRPFHICQLVDLDISLIVQKNRGDPCENRREDEICERQKRKNIKCQIARKIESAEKSAKNDQADMNRYLYPADIFHDCQKLFSIIEKKEKNNEKNKQKGINQIHLRIQRIQNISAQ